MMVTKENAMTLKQVPKIMLQFYASRNKCKNYRHTDTVSKFVSVCVGSAVRQGKTSCEKNKNKNKSGGQLKDGIGRRRHRCSSKILANKTKTSATRSTQSKPTNIIIKTAQS